MAARISTCIRSRFYSTQRHSVTLELKKERLSIQTPAKLLEFPLRWLRDHCQCPQCVHPTNGQKLHSSGQIPSYKDTLLDIQYHPTSSLVQIQWPKPFQHTSSYPISWLEQYSAGSKDPRSRSHHDLIVWDVPTYKREDINYQDYIHPNNKGFRHVLNQLKWYGLAFIHQVPTDLSQSIAVEHVAERVGPIRTTFYGRSWDVKSMPNSKNIAYTNLYLGLHCDLMYFESPPGLQFLHSIKNSVKGGQSLFLDSFKAVSILKKEQPQYYNILTRFPVTFHYQKDDHYMHYKRPIIVDTNINEPLLVNYAPPFQGPLEFEHVDQVDAFYDALNYFESILQRSNMVYETRLEPGTCVVFSNRRVFHGRTEFDSNSGERHLRGTYIDWDDFKDKDRMITV